MKKMLTDFAWIDEAETLHIDIPRLLRQMNVPDTAENRQRALEIATEYLRTQLPKSTVISDVKGGLN